MKLLNLYLELPLLLRFLRCTRFYHFRDRDETNEMCEHKEDNNPLEGVMALSVLAMNLKFDSLPPNECTSDEEHNDKGDVDQYVKLGAPFSRGDPVKLGAPFSRGDPVKAFLDEEAEEEDDTDNNSASVSLFILLLEYLF
ncbi:unnamed protein product [Cuscuta epithymum]|uniref:Uncharacterized protein n=1 Tax=Cuscuta epithymum TaxID=186058 RepID=A0AAV0DDQ2_9ASTE|nr:unnamed protein product [Cuscuta epithymum]